MKFNNKTIDSLAIKYLSAINDISDERNNDDGFWIYLKEPYFNRESEGRIIHEETIKDCIRILKEVVNNPITLEEYNIERATNARRYAQRHFEES